MRGFETLLEKNHKIPPKRKIFLVMDMNYTYNNNRAYLKHEKLNKVITK